MATERQSSLRYEIILYWSDEDDAFIAEVPELPGCAARWGDISGGYRKRGSRYGRVDRDSERVESSNPPNPKVGSCSRSTKRTSAYVQGPHRRRPERGGQDDLRARVPGRDVRCPSSAPTLSLHRSTRKRQSEQRLKPAKRSSANSARSFGTVRASSSSPALARLCAGDERLQANGYAFRF